MGLPIYRNSVEGYITAAHCVGYTGETIGSYEDVYQPDGGSKIGETVDKVYSDNCDCAFIEHTSGEDTETKVWYSEDYGVSITSYTDRVSNGEYVLMTGKTSGTELGQVDDNHSIVSVYPYNFDVVELTTDISDEGDSGAPYTNLGKNNFYGIHKGFNPSTGNSIFFAWEDIEYELGF
jgi:hypothetical protein